MPTPTESLLTRVLQVERFSNKVARAIVRGYAIRVGKAAERVRLITEGDSSLAQQTNLLTESMRDWENESRATAKREILRFGRVEAEFAKHQLERIRRTQIEKPVLRSVKIARLTPEWAEAIVDSNPGRLPTLPKAGVAVLGRKEGKALSLPGKGLTLRAQYRRISDETVGIYNRVVQSGLLQGQGPSAVTRTLIGRIEYDRPALRVSELRQARGALWRAAPQQIATLTRTSMNQVQGQIMKHTLARNDYTHYFYMATLDSRTTVICGSLDGRRFEVGKGPEPPLHFNCRSTMIPASPGQKEALPRGRRAYRDEDGRTRLTSNQSYGTWLKAQSNSVQNSALGASRARLFRRATSEGERPQEVLAQMLRDDGSEASLAELARLDVFDAD